MDPRTSRRIFELARDQQDELAMPDDQDDHSTQDERASHLSRPRTIDEDDDDDDVDSDNAEDVEDIEEIFVRAICAKAQRHG